MSSSLSAAGFRITPTGFDLELEASRMTSKMTTERKPTDWIRNTKPRLLRYLMPPRGHAKSTKLVDTILMWRAKAHTVLEKILSVAAIP